MRTLALIFFTMLSCSIGFAQPSIPEKTFIKSDRSVYVSGEIVWYKVFVLTHEGKPANLSRVCYVELISEDGRRVDIQKHWINKSATQGSLYLPSSLKGGAYQLRAFTLSMLNNDSVIVGVQPIGVINPELRAEKIPSNNVVAETVSLRNILIKGDIDAAPKTRQRLTISSPHLNYNNLNLVAKVFRVDSLSQKDHGGFNYTKIAGLDSGCISEFISHIYTGRMYDQNGKVLSRKAVQLAFPGKSFRLICFTTNNQGEFAFATERIPGVREGKIYIEGQRVPLVSIQFDPIPDLGLSPEIEVKRIPQSWKSDIEHRKLEMQLMHHYYPEIIEFNKDIESSVSAFYGMPEKVYKLDDYTRFPTMEEVFIEYVREVFLRRENGERKFRIGDPERRAFLSSDPLILLDGYVVPTALEVLDIDPLLIEKIEIVTRPFIHGGIYYDGIISLSSYKGDGANYEFADATASFEMTGFQLDRQVFSPTYEDPSTFRLPDFRSLLYWNPEQRSENIEFYTSDVPGTYRIIVEGFDKSGNSYYGEREFAIESKSNLK